MHSQGALGGSATCEHSLALSLGLKELHATGDTTAPVPSMASQPTRRATPVVVGPPPSVPRGPSPPSRSRLERKLRARLAKYARSMNETSSELLKNGLFGFPTLKWIQYTGKVGKCASY